MIEHLLRMLHYGVFGGVLWCSSAPVVAQHLAQQNLYEQHSATQAVATIVQQLTQQMAVQVTHTALRLQGERLSAQSGVLSTEKPALVLQQLHQSLPTLQRLETAPQQMVLSGFLGSNHCLVQLSALGGAEHQLLLSCAALSNRKPSPLVAHSALRMEWSWDERMGKQVVRHQIVSLPPSHRDQTIDLLRRSLQQEGWRITSTAYGLTAEKAGRYLMALRLNQAPWANAAYLLERRP